MNAIHYSNNPMNMNNIPINIIHNNNIAFLNNMLYSNNNNIFNDIIIK